VDVEHFLEKLNRYTTIEAKALYEADEDIRFRSVVNQILGEFRNRYFKLQGRKEGFRGFSLGFLMGTYRLVTYAKLKLMKEYHSENPSSEIEKEYNRVALEIRSEYEE
jgi:hypothetical protein